MDAEPCAWFVARSKIKSPLSIASVVPKRTTIAVLQDYRTAELLAGGAPIAMPWSQLESQLESLHDPFN